MRVRMIVYFGGVGCCG